MLPSTLRIMCPIHLQKVKVATFYGLGEDIIPRNVTDARADARTADRLTLVAYFTKKKGRYKNEYCTKVLLGIGHAYC